MSIGSLTNYSKFLIIIHAAFFNVSLSWAIERRIFFLEGMLLNIGDEIGRLTSLKPKNHDPVWEGVIQSRINKELKDYKGIQSIMTGLRFEPDKDKITDAMIENARSYPFENLMELPIRGNIRCPFHEDRHPSARVKNNFLWCYTCQRGWNPIDYIMEFEHMDFKTAVRRLQ